MIDFYSQYRENYGAFLGRSNQCMGTFDPMNFAVDFDQDIEKYIFSNAGQGPKENISINKTFAWATYLHETIHWWQHIGSTIGFITGLSIPAQAHCVSRYIKNIPNGYPIKKPLFRYVKDLNRLNGGGRNGDVLNALVNNWFDIEFGNAVIRSPKHAISISQNLFFESIGCSYYTMYRDVIKLLADSLKLEIDINQILGVSNWGKQFNSLHSAKEQYFFYGSTIEMPPVGLQDIIEGQARFNEIQFIFQSSNESFGFDKLKELGYMSGQYLNAFELFLYLSDLNWPDTPLSPTINLFLLLCDIAINPALGYPAPISDLRNIIYDNHPGWRFVFGALACKEYPDLLKSLHTPDESSYHEVSSTICNELGWHTPHDVARLVCTLFKKADSNGFLDACYFRNEFPVVNMPIIFIVARHLQYMFDKIFAPDFFCWPGLNTVSQKGNSAAQCESYRNYFKKHSAPFRKNASNFYDSMVYHPPPSTDDNDERIDSLMNSYFSFQIAYDLTRQLVSKNGQFAYSYEWIDRRKKEYFYKKVSNRIFSQVAFRDINEIQYLM